MEVNRIMLKSQIHLQRWRTWMIMWTSVRLAKVLAYRNFRHSIVTA